MISGFVNGSGMAKSEIFAPPAQQVNAGERLSAPQPIEEGFSDIRKQLVQIQEILSDKEACAKSKIEVRSLIDRQIDRIQQAQQARKITSQLAGQFFSLIVSYTVELTYLVNQSSAEKLAELRTERLIIEANIERAKSEDAQCAKNSTLQQQVLQPKNSRPERGSVAMQQAEQTNSSRLFSYFVTITIWWFIIKQFQGKAPHKARTETDDTVNTVK